MADDQNPSNTCSAAIETNGFRAYPFVPELDGGAEAPPFRISG
jgi:hypothetical protein